MIPTCLCVLKTGIELTPCGKYLTQVEESEVHFDAFENAAAGQEEN